MTYINRTGLFFRIHSFAQKNWMPILLFLLFFISPAQAASDQENQWSDFEPSGFDQPILDQWMGVYFHNQKIGFSHTKISEGVKGYKIESKAIFKLEIEKNVNNFSFSQEIYLDPELKPLGFTGLQSLFGNSRFSTGVVEEDAVRIRVESTENTFTKTIPVNGTFMPAGAINFFLFKNGLEVGKEFTFSILLEEFMSLQEIKIKILDKQNVSYEGNPVETFRIQESVFNLNGFLYMDSEGYSIRETTLEGLEMRREPETKAIRFGDGVISLTSLLTYSLIKLKGPLKNPENIKYLKVKLNNLTEFGVLPDDSRQKVLSRIKVENPKSDDSYTLVVEVNRSTLDASNKLSFPVSDEHLKRYLDKTIQIQPDHPDIRKKAEEIIGSESDAWVAAKKINRWVYENINKEFVDTLSSVDTLRQRRGECQSHTYLFAAFARSVGIPTRVSSGIVYSKKYVGFLYHAWPEVYVGNDKWVAMDPTLGQNIADATHIKLANDDNDEQFNLLQFVGKVGLNVLEVQWN